MEKQAKLIKLNCSTFFSWSACLILNELFKNNYGQQMDKKGKSGGLKIKNDT